MPRERADPRRLAAPEFEVHYLDLFHDFLLAWGCTNAKIKLTAESILFFGAARAIVCSQTLCTNMQDLNAPRSL